MARPRNEEQPWYQKVAETMVRESKNIRQAATEHGLELTTEELHGVEKRKAFQQVLWTERHRFWQELANDPERGKLSLVGQMLFLVQKLIDEGSYDKALEGLMKIAKVDGIVGPEQQVNVFGGVTPKDLEEARKQIESKLKSGAAGLGTIASA